MIPASYEWTSFMCWRRGMRRSACHHCRGFNQPRLYEGLEGAIRIAARIAHGDQVPHFKMIKTAERPSNPMGSDAVPSVRRYPPVSQYIIDQWDPLHRSVSAKQPDAKDRPYAGATSPGLRDSTQDVVRRSRRGKPAALVEHRCRKAKPCGSSSVEPGWRMESGRGVCNSPSRKRVLDDGAMWASDELNQYCD